MSFVNEIWRQRRCERVEHRQGVDRLSPSRAQRRMQCSSTSTSDTYCQQGCFVARLGFALTYEACHEAHTNPSSWTRLRSSSPTALVFGLASERHNNMMAEPLILHTAVYSVHRQLLPLAFCTLGFL